MTESRTIFSTQQKWAFSLGSFAQWFINSSFNTWVLTFYFAAIGLRIELIMTAFVIWTIWNAINDPLIGYISDRTNTRWGRRKPFITLAVIPIAIIEIILWVPPLPAVDESLTFTYLLLMLLAYDTVYTSIALPYDSLFPELYTSSTERAEVNTIRQILATIGLIAAFLIPGIFIGDQNNPEGYLTNGIVTAIIVTIVIVISLRWGVRERKEFIQDSHHEFNFFEGLRYTFRNRGFVLYTIMFFLYEYVLLVLSTTVPLFAREVLGITDTFLTSILLGSMFIVGIVTVFIWRYLDVRLGSRRAFFYSIVLYLIASFPLLFVDSFITALAVVIFMGVGFGGMLYFIYLIIADVVDEDELKTGVRREGTFFGITNFFMRLAMIFSISTVSLVFVTTGWEEYVPNPGIDVIMGLRMLVFVFPAISLVLSLICLYFYPYTKNRVQEIKDQLIKLHTEKLRRMEN